MPDRMPLFVVRCLYGPGATERRPAATEEHLAYLRANAHRLRFAGPLLLDDGTPAGSLAIVEVADRQGAEDYIDQEAFRKAGMFETIEITRFSSLLNNWMVDLEPAEGRQQFLVQWTIPTAPAAGRYDLTDDQFESGGATVMEAGPRLSDDGTEVIGGLRILEAVDRGVATTAATAAAAAERAGYTDLVVQRWRFGKALTG
jgi:uncharacterized protein